jgi:hypothetical protein
MSDEQVTFLELPATRSTDSLPVRATSSDLIDLDKVATHIERLTLPPLKGAGFSVLWPAQRQSLPEGGAPASL